MTAELGTTQDPAALVPGNPAHAEQAGQKLAAIAGGLEQTMRGGDENAWTGQAAEAYRDQVKSEQKRWDAGHAAFTQAARAISEHAAALRAGQDTASRAIALYEKGRAAGDSARAQHDQQVAAAGPAERPPAFQDPGAAAMAEAEALLEQARAGVRRSAAAAADALRAATAKAPQPGVLDQLKEQMVIASIPQKSFLTGVAGALGDTAKGLASAFGATSGLHLAADPAGTAAAMAQTQAGLVHSVTTRDGFTQMLGQTVGTAQEWRSDPLAALGKAVTNVGGTLVGGGGIAKARGLIGRTAEEAAPSPVARPASASPSAEPAPDAAGPRPAEAAPETPSEPHYGWTDENPFQPPEDPGTRDLWRSSEDPPPNSPSEIDDQPAPEEAPPSPAGRPEAQPPNHWPSQGEIERWKSLMREAEADLTRAERENSPDLPLIRDRVAEIARNMPKQALDTWRDS